MEEAAAEPAVAAEDLYTKYKRLTRQLEFLNVQESYIKDEHRNLKKELVRAQVGGLCVKATAV